MHGYIHRQCRTQYCQSKESPFGDSSFFALCGAFIVNCHKYPYDRNTNPIDKQNFCFHNPNITVLIILCACEKVKGVYNMQKRFLWAVLLIAAAAGAIYFFLRQSVQVQPPQETPTAPTVSASEEVRAVWVNYNELSMKALGGGTQADFQNKAEEMCRNIRASGMNTVIVHVRPFCDAFYASELFPWSVYLTGIQGQGVDYDPLGIFLAAAKAQNLSVQAWINPYRVLLSAEWEKLSDNNPAKQWYTSGKTENLLLTEDGIYLNPASLEVQTLIINGVREILRKYGVDAIHMDDYFYPSNDPSVDAASYASYQQAGGRLSQDDWRRENVSMFVSALYAAIKAQNPQTQLVISPGGDIRKNHDNLYADVERWAREPGFLECFSVLRAGGIQMRQRGCTRRHRCTRMDTAGRYFGASAETLPHFTALRRVCALYLFQHLHVGFRRNYEKRVEKFQKCVTIKIIEEST